MTNERRREISPNPKPPRTPWVSPSGDSNAEATLLTAFIGYQGSPAELIFHAMASASSPSLTLSCLDTLYPLEYPCFK